MLLGMMAANAHETFVRPISGWVNVGDIAVLPIGSGHNTSSTELPEGFAYVKISSQSGQVLNHTLNEKTATNGFWKLYDFDVDEPGLYVVDLYHTEGSWTHFITNPPATGYWEHAYVDEIDFDALNTTGWADDWYVERSYPKLCYAKAFVAGPSSDFSLASKPIGQALEMVPLDNITSVGDGEFEFQVFFQGQPFDNLTVTAERVGDDTKLEAVTDEEGKVKLNLTESSEITEWLIRTDTGMDQRVVELTDLPRGRNSQEKSYVGPVYRTALTLRNDYIMNPA
ncbi:MAG: DUF4198 domain-containing protein [Methanotrichaceae archaeon]|nr:DUF4198 domain-containing protein [Methanotrichaceae archaeon]